jgi:hypothetical protein
MNCQEFQELLADILDGSAPGQEGHALHCETCASLHSDLKEISNVARMLRAHEEPSPRVWNSIEIALREEGLIREPLRSGPVLVTSRPNRWKMGWLVPVAALLLVMTSGVAVYQRSAKQNSARMETQTSIAQSAPTEDAELLQEVSDRAPSLRPTYAADLNNVNAYIQQAQASVRDDPNDQEAQHSLMQAYEQRSMIYELALDRSLP